MNPDRRPAAFIEAFTRAIPGMLAASDRHRARGRAKRLGRRSTAEARESARPMGAVLPVGQTHCSPSGLPGEGRHD